MKNIKCDSCGANVHIEDNQNNLTCPYCESNICNNNSNDIAQQTTIINNYYGEKTNASTPTQSPVPDYVNGNRPKANIGLTIFLFMFYFWPGIIYLAYIGHKQRKWDEHNKK